MNTNITAYETGFNHGLKNDDPEHNYIPEYGQYSDGVSDSVGVSDSDGDSVYELYINVIDTEMNNVIDPEMNKFYDEMEQNTLNIHFAEILTISKFVIINNVGFSLEKINDKYVLVSPFGNKTENVFAMVYDYCKKHENSEFSITEEETTVINNFEKTYLGNKKNDGIIETLEKAFRETFCDGKSLK